MTRSLAGTNEANTWVMNRRSAGSDEVSISTVNKGLAEALKEKKTWENASQLDQVSDSSLSSFNLSNFGKYITTVAHDKADELKSLFGLDSIKRLMEGLGSTPRMKNLISGLLEYIANPSQEIFNRKLSQFFASSERGLSLLSDEWSKLRANSKTDALAKAALAVGLTGHISGAKESIKTLADDTVNIQDKAKQKELENLQRSLSHVFNSNGDILGESGEPLQSAIHIKADEIEKLYGENGSSVVKEGKLNWSEFTKKTCELAMSDDTAKLVEYVHNNLAIYNKQMRELSAAAGNAKAKADVEERAKAVVRLFTGKSGLLPEVAVKAFQKAFKNGAFLSDESITAIVGEAAEEKANASVASEISEISDSVKEHGQLGDKDVGKLASLIKNKDTNTLSVFDLEGIIDGSKKGTADVDVSYHGDNKVTFAKVSKAYAKSAASIADKITEKLLADVLGGREFNKENRDKYLGSGLEIDNKNRSISEDSQKIAEGSKKLTDADPQSANDLISSISSAIAATKDFRIDLSDLSVENKLIDDMTAKFLSIASVRRSNTAYETEVREAVNNIVTDLKANQDIKTGLANLFTLITDKTSSADGKTVENASTSTKKNRYSRLQSEFSKEATNTAFIKMFVDMGNSEDALANISFDAIDSLVTDEAKLSSAILSQSKNTDIDSIEDLKSDNKHLKASSEAALIFATPEDVKKDSERNKMRLLGLLGLLKNANVATNPKLLNKVIERLFSRTLEESRGEVRTARIEALAAKLKAFLDAENKIEGIEGDADVHSLAQTSGASMIRSLFLNTSHSVVQYNKESVAGNRLASMINHYVLPENLETVSGNIKTIVDAIKSARDSLDGKPIGDLREMIKGNLGNDASAISIVNNLFGWGDDALTYDSNEKINVANAFDKLDEIATRLSIVLPRLNSGASSTSTRSAEPAMA